MIIIPATARWCVHGVQGRKKCIDYIKNPDKTMGGKLVTGINCSAELAHYEMENNSKKFNVDENEDSRTCYHAYQSFDPKEKNLTPEEVHQIGIELAKKLYPEFQVVVCTHVDHLHLHNHFCISAVNLKGRKLEDRLSNPIEGLYGLRDASDQIALQHGLHIIEDAPKIGHYHKNKYLYDLANSSWKSQIIETLDSLKERCYSFDEMLEQLALDGYQIKSGKNIRIKPYGKERFVTMKILGDDYSEESLKEFFKDKRRHQKNISFENYELNVNDSDILNIYDELAKLSKHSVLYTMKDLDSNSDYYKYYNSRYLEVRRYHKLVDTIKFLNANEIYNYDSLESQIKVIQNDIKKRENEYNSLLSQHETLQLRVPLCNLFIKYLDDYNGYLEQQEIYPVDAELPKEVQIFLDVKKELNVETPQEVEDIINEANKMKMDMNQKYAYLTYLKNKASELEKIKGISLETEKGYIKSVSISAKMIDESRSSENEYCIRIPYSEYYLYVPKTNVAWIGYNSRGIIYLIDDKEYSLYDKDDYEIRKANGEEIEEISQTEKQKVSEYYKIK
ncbi:MAG: relaxase/mobilization nuclease domain-containing protein [Bacilli bacterium]|nr:relaxase/mobilization nuclease domain-containing protein [Bacilli bacterium]MBP3920110.1 relaxase/mobilization nuclease domain-containing protein [Bacilli bacterium]